MANSCWIQVRLSLAHNRIRGNPVNDLTVLGATIDSIRSKADVDPKVERQFIVKAAVRGAGLGLGAGCSPST
jgi:hypothetical protein